ncbi:MAG: M1 family metallopeptidase [Bacteroidia bacterium]|jgi:hypothetical protein|nr:M1 family metallopeptidase [Bacteroidia bacterium]
MKKTLLVFFLMAIQWVAQSQHAQQANWQQRVNYTIDVTLDDIAHVLRGHIAIVYHNQSLDTLSEIYMHLWPNAYQNNQTAFAKQQLENGTTTFYELPESDRGKIDSLSFTVNKNVVDWKLTEHIDVAKIRLSSKLLPGDSIRIETPFRVFIPKVVSRMGHEGQLYCITQWYPKPAVYDANGWNPMPYLDQGEFYSEFGSFTVNLTLPQNYVVAATGRLQNEDERKWLWDRSAKRFDESASKQKENPISSDHFKTLTYIQDSIHDFAWFADKRFSVERSEVQLPSGKKVTTWMYEIAPRTSSVKWIDTAVLYYSTMLGEYPYTDASVCVTPLISGAGMEYPMVTNITESGRQVIVHEVGHNWLYGILATNERLHPWMDESINNYYETRSAETENYKPKQSLSLSSLGNFGSEGYAGLEQRYLIGARKNEDQGAFLRSEVYTDYNYGAIIYGKASTNFHYLQRYLGDTVFDSMMRSYYEKWKFKHPLPGDLINHVNEYTGKDLTWFWNGLMQSTAKQDWAVKSLRKDANGYQLTIENKSNINAPVSISAMANNQVVYTKWVDSTAGPISIPNGAYNYIRVDAFENTIDIDRGNNSIRTNGILRKCEPLKFKLLADAENPYQNQVFFTPIVGANLYDKTMLGLAFYNSLLPVKKTEYILAPMYGLGSKQLVGSGELTHHIWKYGYFRKISLSVHLSQFAFEPVIPSTFTRVEGSARFIINQQNPRVDPKSEFLAAYITTFDRLLNDNLANAAQRQFFQLSFTSNQQRKLYPYAYQIGYEFGTGPTFNPFHKLQGEAIFKLNYAKLSKGFTVRLFGGLFLNPLDLTAQDNGLLYYRAGAQTGIYDYTYSQSQFGRSENPILSNSIFAQQLMIGGLQFKELYPMLFTDKWACGTNLETTIPGILPIVLYGDIALLQADQSFFDGNTGSFVRQYKVKLVYTSGISLKLFKDIFRVNFPLLASADIVDYFSGEGIYAGSKSFRYTERITFSLNLNKLNLVKQVREISL